VTPEEIAELRSLAELLTWAVQHPDTPIGGASAYVAADLRAWLSAHPQEEA